MAILDSKFSNFADGGDLAINDIVVGLRGGVNTRFSFQGVPNTYLPLAGGTMLGAIDMNSNAIIGLPLPTNPNDATSKSYVDTAITTALGSYLPLAGGTMSGVIAMGANKITGLADCTNPQDAATKAYVDSTGSGTVTSGLINQLAWYAATGATVSGLATLASGLLVTSAGSVPSIATDIPTAVTIGGAYIYRVGGTDVIVSDGGTGVSSFTAYGVICGGTTSTGSLQTVSGLGSANQVLVSNGAGALPSWQSVPGLTPAALTKTDDTNVTMTLGGTPTTALLQATSMTLGWTGQLGVSRGGTGLAAVTAHYLPIGNGTSALTLLAPNATSGIPLISQGVAADPTYGTAVVAGGGTGITSATAYAILCGGTTSTGAFQSVSGLGSANQVLVSNGAGALPTWQSVPGLTPAALTKVDDTNVTLTLGGTPATALLQAASITAGWTGQLGLTRGGTAASLTASTGGIVYSSASALAILAGTATAGQMLQSGATAAPAWSTTTYPATNAINTIMYATSANVLGSIAAVNSAVMISSAGGVPSFGTTLPNINIGTPTAGVLTNCTGLPVGGGGTGNSTFTAYSLICAGTTATGAFQNVSGLGTSGQVLQSNGAGALPSWVTIPGATSAALTKGDDTNVTLTLGGTPTTALLTAASITAGWTGQLSLTRGGTAASLTASNGGIVYSSASALAILSGTATAGLALLSGASGAPTWSSSPPLTRVVIQKFTASGTYTPTSGMKYCIIECVGAGAGGGGAANSTGLGCGGGGGGGSYARIASTAATIGASQTVTIGTAGTAGGAGNTTGGNGGDTSVGTICIGKGGSGGGGNAGNGQAIGGAGGVAGTGDLTIVGQDGGAGGGATIATVTMPSGFGGASFFGGGAPGSRSTVTGLTATVFGGGGSGGNSVGAGGAIAGGAGFAGYVIITEFVSV